MAGTTQQNVVLCLEEYSQIFRRKGTCGKFKNLKTKILFLSNVVENAGQWPVLLHEG